MNSLEKLVERLCGLYESFGFQKYKMSKFEEYDLYARNKDLLASEGIITFTDTNGKLMALKPDVTLSIIRNTRESVGAVTKVYYNENVYRVSKGSKVYKEIMQTGLECTGDIDDYSVLEVLLLAAKSLKVVSEDSMLMISLPSIIGKAAEKLGMTDAEREKALALISGKNMHELSRLLAEGGYSGIDAVRLIRLAGLSGVPSDVIPALKNAGAAAEDIAALSGIADTFNEMGLGGMLRFDLSQDCDTRYYSGFVFKGYVKGIPSAVLSGGRYDALMHRMGKKYGAIGFALYTDLLERFSEVLEGFDADTVVLYGKNTAASAVLAKVNALADGGKKVAALRKVPEGFTYKEFVSLDESGVKRNG